jgi:hypothetical protein
MSKAAGWPEIKLPVPEPSICDVRLGCMGIDFTKKKGGNPAASSPSNSPPHPAKRSMKAKRAVWFR